MEFATHSVTSPGFEFLTRGIDPKEVAGAMMSTNAGLAYADTSQRGYTSVMLGPDAAIGQFHFLKTIRERSTELAATRRFRVAREQRTLAEIQS